ncbi:MAG: PD-(D/E)XK nuclease family protein, partial [Acidobacteria bacterium]|nr:PD-(D/E)XK nuclease family protein [Acidobacteriota bacterium]
FRKTLIEAALSGTPVDIRRRALILPSRGAIELLRRGIEDAHLQTTGTAAVMPAMLTREDWLAHLHAGLPDAPALIGRIEREVLFDRAARAAAQAEAPPFAARPGLVAAMLDFYDELRRRGRTVTRFADVLAVELAGADRDDDRGSHELMRQTAFLTRVFDEYEQRLTAPGAGIDEHLLRARVLAALDTWDIDHIVVAVADHPTDPRGLWPADFDLLGRLSSLLALDIVVTDDTHDAGFRERIDREVPELDDERVTAERSLPSLLVPERTDASATAPDERVCIDYRDREEEVREVARVIRWRAAAGATAPLSRTAVVFQRPLPYLYLAQQVLGEAGVPFQAFDTLPLSAEPWAALLDLALSVARTGGTRDSVLALARSPLLHLEVDGAVVTLVDLARLDRLLIEGRVTSAPSEYVGAIEPLIASARRPDAAIDQGVRRAARVAADLATRLAVFRDAPTASAQIDAVSSTLRALDRRPPAIDRDRHLRARSAVLTSLDRLAAAYRQYDDAHRDPDTLSATIHHWIERQTFTPRQGTTGVHLVDAVAARFGAFDHVHLVGLVDAEWPERQRRSIFYTSSLLKELGWPGEDDHLRSQQAAFRDLVRLPTETLSLSAFQLEGDAVVASTPLTDEARILPRRTRPVRDVRIFADERLALAPMAAEDLAPAATEWLALRHARPELTSPAYRGDVGAQAPREYRVSSLDRFVECPFKYFAGVVLRLDEDVEEESALTPRERGTLLHSLFERFYRDWDAAGQGAITMATLPDAVAAFEQLAREAVSTLPEADRVLETARLLGSIVMRGAAERVFLLEADDSRKVQRRWMEHQVNGTYDFPAGFAPPKSIAIRGVADRIDELSDGTLRLIDYKLSKPPRAGAVQLKVYGYVAQQQLKRQDGREHPVSVADYVSFGDDASPVSPVAGKGTSVQQAIEAGAQEFAAHVTQIESGQFPPQPQNAGLCEWCAFSLVCRKETMEGDDDDAAEPV